jgi:NADH-quinone oxidoreductase subunit H
MSQFVPILIVIIKAHLVLGIVMGFALMTIWLERKVSALIQDRVGANRASILRFSAFNREFSFDLAGMVNTAIADPVKALMKEDWIPKGANPFLHAMGPFLALFPVLVSFAVIPIGPSFQIADQVVTMQLAELNFGILYVFAMGSLSVYGSVLAGWVSQNKFSLLGGLRASAQMISYEVTMGISILGVIAIYQSLEPGKIIEYQNQLFFGLPAWGVFLNPIGFLIFFVSMMAETKRAPFDLPEGESEIVAGYLTEYSGMKFLLFWFGEFAEIVIASAMVVLLFFGGWQLPYVDVASLPFAPLIGAVVFLGKVFIFCVLQVTIRWTLPRFRYDQLMDLCWKYMLPISIVNLIATVALLLTREFYPV